MKRRDLLAFVHIEKTAGTSMVHILRHCFFPVYADVRPLTHRKRIFQASDLRRYFRINPFLKVISGHSVVPWSGLEQCADISYITLLRNPISRYVSQFRYWQSHLGKSISIEQYLNREDSKNIQTKKIAGCEDIDRAIEFIGRKNFYIGLVEKFDEFLVELQTSFHPDGFRAIKIEKNINRIHNTAAQDIIDRYHDEIVDNNRLDITLYNKVKAKLEVKYGNRKHNVLDIPSCHYTPQLIADYVVRKSYLEPVSNWIRMQNGLDPEGSY